MPLCLSSLTAASLAEFAPGQAQKKGSKGKKTAVAIADPSDWDVRITRPNGNTQKAAVRLRDGVIDPAGNKAAAAGKMWIDDAGDLASSSRGIPGWRTARPC